MHAKLNSVLLALCVVASAIAVSAIGQEPTPAPVSVVTVEPSEATVAKVDGRWVVASETRRLAALIRVDGEAKHIRVDVPYAVSQDGSLKLARGVSVTVLPSESGRLYGVSGPAGEYLANVICSDPELGIVVERVTVTIGKQPDPPNPDDPPTPDSNWAAVLKPAAAAAKLTSAEAKVFAAAFRNHATGSYESVRVLTESTSKQYTAELGINRSVDLIDFRAAIVAELQRLKLTTVSALQAEFVHLADALEVLP